MIGWKELGTAARDGHDLAYTHIVMVAPNSPSLEMPAPHHYQHPFQITERKSYSDKGSTSDEVRMTQVRTSKPDMQPSIARQGGSGICVYDDVAY